MPSNVEKEKSAISKITKNTIKADIIALNHASSITNQPMKNSTTTVYLERTRVLAKSVSKKTKAAKLKIESAMVNTIPFKYLLMIKCTVFNYYTC